jgi:hypothetical protein
MSRHTAGGDSGNSRGSTPKAPSAAATRRHQQLPLGVVGKVFAEHAAAALHDAADHLAVQGQRVDDMADIVDHDVVEDLDVTGARIDRHMDGGGAVAVGRSRALEHALDREPGERGPTEAAPIARLHDAVADTDIRRAEARRRGDVQCLAQIVRRVDDGGAAHHGGA